MTQMQILGAIDKFLAVTNPKAHTHLTEILKGGHCFGFTVVYAAMRKIGMGNWWKAMLHVVISWDGDPKKLDEKLILPQTKNIVTVRQIFSKVIDFVIPHQVGKENTFRRYHITQMNMLSASGEYFEIFDVNGTKHTIAGNNCIAGAFTKDTLIKLLHEQHISDGICLLRNSDHVISISFENDKWIVYDSNYSHDSLDTMHKEFTSKDEMLNEVVAIQGVVLALEVAWFHGESREIFNPFNTYFDKLSDREIAALLNDQAIALLATHADFFLKKVVRAAQSSWLIRDAMFAGLFHIDALGISGLAHILSQMPACFYDIHSMFRTHKNYADNILDTFAHISKDGDTNFCKLLKYSGNYLVTLYQDVLQYSIRTPDVLIKVFEIENSAGLNGLWVVLTYKPDFLYTLLTCASKSVHFPDTFARLLTSKNKEKQSFLQAIIASFSIALPFVVQQLTLATQSHHMLAPMFLSSDEHIMGILQVRADAPQYLPAVLELLANRCNLIDWENYVELITVLENAPDFLTQFRLLQNLITQSQNLTLEVIPWLPNNFAKKRELAAEIVRTMIARTQSPAGLRELILQINSDPAFDFLTKRVHVTSIFNQSKKLTARQSLADVWIKLLENAAHKMTALLATQDNPQDSDKEFLANHLQQPVNDCSVKQTRHLTSFTA